MSEVGSKRAELLKRALICINSGSYDDNGRYLVFGASSVWDMMKDLTDSPSDREDYTLEDAVNKLASDSKLHDGRGDLAGRVALGSMPNFKTDALESLSSEQRQVLREAMMDIVKEVRNNAQHTLAHRAVDTRDLIDAAFAEELLGKLPKAVSRALRLDSLTISRVPNEAVKGYFEEAHRCYLFGFPVACVVLCRAILASALEDCCDPRRQIYAVTPRNHSYFKALVENARLQGLLSDDRPEWAIKIKDAGDHAIHDLPKFSEHWRSKVEDILLNTRKILLDLYRVPDRVS